jgi:penicillin-binding protein 1A
LSLNSVAVRLTLESGPAAVAKTAYRLGITSQLDPNPSLALGTSEVSVLELVGAYAPFANGGMAVTPRVVERIRSADGRKTIYASADASAGRVIDARYVAMMNSMMRATLTIGTARKADLPGWVAAGKTGTSQDFRDAWFIGYTSHLVTGVWLGNDNSSPTKKATGGSLPVEIWSRFMKVAHQNVAVADLPGLTRGGGLFAPIPAATDRLTSADRQLPADRLAPAPVAATPNARPQADHGLDGWFLQRLFGRR